MDIQTIDPLYKVIEIDDKQRVDVIEKFERDFERLKNIGQLGWVSEVIPSARHSKWEHAVGTYHIAKIAMNRIRGLDVNRDHFLAASLLHSIGHLPYTFASSRAVFIAYRESTRFQKKLDSMIKSAQEILHKHKLTPGEMFKKTFQNDRDIPRILTMYTVVNSYSGSRNTDLVNHLIEYLSDRRSLGYQLLDICDQIDYVMRDLYHSGTATLTLNYEALFKAIAVKRSGDNRRLSLENIPEWRILRSCRELLFDRLLSDTRVIACETVFTSSLSVLLAANKIDLDTLLKMDDNSLRDKIFTLDDKLQESIKHCVRGTYEHVLSRESGFRSKIPQIESKIIERATRVKGIQSPNSDLLISVKNWETRGSKIFVLASKNGRLLRPVLQVCDFINKNTDDINPFQPRSTQEMNIEIIRLLFRRFHSVECGTAAIDALSEFLSHDFKRWVKAGIAYFNKDSVREEPYYIIYSRKSESRSPRGLPLVFRRITERGVKPSSASRFFAELIIWNQNYFRKPFYNELKGALLRECKNPHKPSLKEAYSLISEVETSFNFKSKWILPNVKCCNSGGASEREIDVVSVYLDNSVNVTFSECSDRNTESKSAGDAQKISELQSEILQNFDDVNVRGKVYGPKPNIAYVI